MMMLATCLSHVTFQAETKPQSSSREKKTKLNLPLTCTIIWKIRYVSRRRRRWWRLQFLSKRGMYHEFPHLLSLPQISRLHMSRVLCPHKTISRALLSRRIPALRAVNEACHGLPVMVAFWGMQGMQGGCISISILYSDGMGWECFSLGGEIGFSRWWQNIEDGGCGRHGPHVESEGLTHTLLQGHSKLTYTLIYSSTLRLHWSHPLPLYILPKQLRKLHWLDNHVTSVVTRNVVSSIPTPGRPEAVNRAQPVDDSSEREAQSRL